MPAAPLLSRSSASLGRTFVVASSILGTAALMQVGAVTWAFVTRFKTTPFAEVPRRPTLWITRPDADPRPREFSDPFGEESPALTSLPPGAITPPPKPTPIPQQTLRQAAAATPEDGEATSEARFAETVAQARTLRDRGDMHLAITRLREAQVLDPGNALPLAEIAVTYEKMGVSDRAAEHWRRVFEMGEAAGVYYAAAEAKLRATQLQATAQARAGIPPRTDSPVAPGEPVGLGPSSKLGLGEIVMSEERDPAALKKILLRIPLQAKARARIDVRDVTIQVVFYDMMNGKTLEQTNAQVATSWTNPPPDWSDADVEVLEVSYIQPIPVQGEPMTSDRKYAGYIATIYYKEALQDSHAEPAQLAQNFPPARVLSRDTPPP